MCTISILRMGMIREILVGCSSPGSDLPCCSAPLSVPLRTNSEHSPIWANLCFLFVSFLGNLWNSPFFCVLRGRKRASVTYCISYILSCITKHSPQYKVLMLGRILGGIATSLLFSAFESWLVAEHNKVDLNYHFYGCKDMVTVYSEIFLGTFLCWS